MSSLSSLMLLCLEISSTHQMKHRLSDCMFVSNWVLLVPYNTVQFIKAVKTSPIVTFLMRNDPPYWSDTLKYPWWVTDAIFSPLSPTQCVAWSMDCSSHASNCLVECVADGRNGVLVFLWLCEGFSLGRKLSRHWSVHRGIWDCVNCCLAYEECLYVSAKLECWLWSDGWMSN